MEIAQLIGFAALGLALGALAWNLWFLFHLRREEKRLFSSWGEPWEGEKFPKLPRDPLERAFKIGELLRHLQREAILGGLDKNKRRAEVKLQTTPWGIRVISPAGTTELWHYEADRFVEDMKLLLRDEERELVEARSLFKPPLRFKSGPDGLIFEHGDFRVRLEYGLYWLENFLEHHQKARQLLRELEEIKDVAEELVGALKAMEALGVG